MEYRIDNVIHVMCWNLEFREWQLKPHKWFSLLLRKEKKVEDWRLVPEVGKEFHSTLPRLTLVSNY